MEREEAVRRLKELGESDMEVSTIIDTMSSSDLTMFVNDLETLNKKAAPTIISVEEFIRRAKAIGTHDGDITYFVAEMDRTDLGRLIAEWELGWLESIYAPPPKPIFL